MTEYKINEQQFKKKVKATLDFHLALISDTGDWHYAYGLIEMAHSLGLLSNDEKTEYENAADEARKRKNLLFDRIMQELKCLVEDNPPETANYWIIDNKVNVFGYIEDNGDDDRWIVLILEQYDESGDMVKSEEFATDDVNEKELVKQLELLLSALDADIKKER